MKLSKGEAIKSIVVGVRLTDKESEFVKVQAAKEFVTKSQYIRRQIFLK